MSKDSRLALYENALGDWKICEKVGTGSGGKTAVYRIEKRNNTYTEQNALKVINISDETGIYNQLSDEQRAAYQKELTSRKQKAESELAIMHTLRDVPEIVDFHEHKFVDWQEDRRFGCDLLIRMDYLECLRPDNDQIIAKPADAVRIGISMCSALAACHNHEQHIIHRDVKPENIFKKGDNWYQLGDFGIARTLGDSGCASTFACTEPYAAPEVLGGGKYTKLADIYSLGVMLYEICNDGCLPFAESVYDKRTSIEKRMTEDLITPPKNADDRLAAIIIKACAKNPKDRWQSAQEMQNALKDPYTTKLGHSGGEKKRSSSMIAAVIVLLLCIGAAAYFSLPGIRSNGEPTEQPPSAGTPYSPENTGNSAEEGIEQETQDAADNRSNAARSDNEPDGKTENESDSDQQDNKESESATSQVSNAEQTAQTEPRHETEQTQHEPQPATEQTQHSEPQPISATSVQLNMNELHMKNGGNARLTVSVAPENADDRTVTWQSSDKSVVTVSNGTLIAVGDGTANITASAGGKNAKCTVTVETVWSDWADVLPDGITSTTDTRTVYRYTDYHKETTTTYSSTPPSGYTLEYTSQEDVTEPERVVDVEGHYEYRYGCWIGANGGHSYCNVMAEEYYGAPAELLYTNWSTERFQRVGTGGWGCGYSDDTPGHQHIVSDDSWTGKRDSRWYPLYSATGSTKTAEGYFWEESRWVDTTYKTIDRVVTKTVYHYYRMVKQYESGWETDKPPAKDGRDIEEKKQYRYMITD